MKRLIARLAVLGLFLGAVMEARAGELIVNGGFETGNFAGWTETDQAGGSGSWFVNSSTTSPLSGFVTPGPASGSFYALTDQTGPGSHSLVQAFTVAAGSTVNLSFDMFSNNQSGSMAAVGGASDLDYTIAPNQHARVDILTAGAGPFDTAGGVVANLYNGSTFAPPGGTNPWVHYSFDITADVGGGGTFQLRFAEVDNQLFFQQGVDNVSITASGGTIPEPTGITLLGLGIAGVAGLRLRRRSQPA